MNTYKSPHAYDSFENSIKQIHNTNRLLNTIENKLSDFLLVDPKSMISPKESSSTRDLHNPLMNRSRPSNTDKEDHLQLSGLGFTSPYGDKDLSNYLSPSDDLRQNRMNLNSSQRRIPENVKPLASIENLPRRDLGIDMDRLGKNEDMFGGSENWRKMNSELDGERGKMSGHALINKMDKIEETYQAKIQILEERLHSSEYENDTLRKQNDRLEHEAMRLRNENNDLQNKLAREQRRTLEDEEIGNARYQAENERLKLKLEELTREYREVLEEKDGIKNQYNELMKVHNQMIELDMQKNEKTLREHNMSMRRFDEIEDFAESISAYQQEVDVLKESNVLAQKQMKYEMQKLRDELRHQKDENDRINRALQEERINAAKKQAISPIRSERKPDRNERSGRKREYFDDDLLNLSKGELAKITRGLQESYAYLEVKHQEQVKQNERLQGELQTLGETSKEEIERFNEAFSEVYDGNRVTHTSLPRRSEDMHREPRSAEKRTRKQSQELSLGRRERLRQDLRRDLAEIEVIGRVKSSPARHARSQSKSVRFSPEAEFSLEKKPSKTPKEFKGHFELEKKPSKTSSEFREITTRNNHYDLERKPSKTPKEFRENSGITTRSHAEFERELKSLKEMVNHSLPLKKIKERQSKRLNETGDISVKMSTERSRVKAKETGEVKSKAKVTKDKEKKRKKIGNL